MPSKLVPTASLLLDYNLYPRHRLDSVNLGRIAEAVAVGEPLPPVIADAESKRIIDGFHRITIALRVNPEGKIRCEFHNYASEADMFLDAVRRNARHGVPLSAYDQARVQSMADTWSISPSELAAAMSIRSVTLDRIKTTRTAFAGNGEVMIKRSFGRLAGQTLTPEQVLANERASGWPASFHANQLADLIEAGVIDWDDEATINAIERLTRLLSA